MEQSKINKFLINGDIIKELKKEERARDLRTLGFIILICTIFIGFYCIKVESLIKENNANKMNFNDLKRQIHGTETTKKDN